MDSPVAAEPQLSLSEPALDELERRVHFLEDAVARLEDTSALEERIAARVTDRLPQSKAPTERDTGILEERILAKMAERMPAASSAVDHAKPQDNVQLPYETTPGGGWSAWLLLDMYTEAKLLVQMIRDRRYRMAWTTRVTALLLLPAILTTNWWFPLAWVPGVGGLIVNVVNLVLAFALYRALSREGRRYHETVLRR